MLIAWPWRSGALEQINPQLVGWMRELSDECDNLTDWYLTNRSSMPDGSWKYYDLRISLLLSDLDVLRLSGGITDTTKLREEIHTVYQNLIQGTSFWKGSATDRELQLLREYEQSITRIVNNVNHILAYLETARECRWLRTT